MANLNQNNIFVQVRIKEETEIGQFNDSMYFTLSEFEALTDAEVEQKKKERVDKWVAFVKEQRIKVPEEPSVEELMAQKEDLQSKLNEVNEKLTSKQNGK